MDEPALQLQPVQRPRGDRHRPTWLAWVVVAAVAFLVGLGVGSRMPTAPAPTPAAAAPSAFVAAQVLRGSNGASSVTGPATRSRPQPGQRELWQLAHEPDMPRYTVAAADPVCPLCGATLSLRIDPAETIGGDPHIEFGPLFEYARSLTW